MPRWNSFDEQMMRRAIEIARSGGGYTLSNPRVGAVISLGERIAAEGYHQRYGGPHAERNAIAEARRKGVALRDASLYVTLEPCCHQGKTGPCTEAIIEAGIGRVVIGTRDPNPKVRGGGIARLRNAGIRLEEGLLEDACKALNPGFNTFHTLQRPYVILKWARSLDGYIDTVRPAGSPAPWLTGNQGRLIVHRWRSECMAILVGANTVLRDNPQLNVRAWVGPQPLRVVVDRDLSLPRTAHIIDGSQPTLILTAPDSLASTTEQSLQSIAQLETAALRADTPMPSAVLSALYERGINSLLIEGGTKTIEQFIAANLWDEARVFVSPTLLGCGVAAPKLPHGLSTTTRLNDATLLEVLNRQPAQQEVSRHA